MTRSTPRVLAGALQYRDGAGDRTISVGNPAWWQWLAAVGNTTFRFEHQGASYTARREGVYWYAYRKQARRLLKAYLGKSGDLELERLETVASTLRERIASTERPSAQRRPSSDPPSTPVRHGLADTHNLPNGLSSLVGRELELAEVPRLLQTTRLVTLTGPGGVGKTRLALGAARSLLNEYSGVWLVELAPLTDPGLVHQMVAAALGVREGRGRPLLAAVIDRIGDAHMLLVLDNCEHVAAASATLVQTLLRECPRLTILATSRQALRIPSEVTRPVPTLALPEQTLPPPEQLVQYTAVQLFVERARAVRPDFDLTSRNTRAVAEICRRLDGLPLAIELAAAWAQVLAPEQLLTRLSDRFRLLVDGGGTVPPRQQTLRGVIDWSYALLAPTERTLFRRLAVFAGGFALEAAEAVCAGADLQEQDVLPLLRQLVSKSLVATEARNAASSVRYRMLETLRAYAWERAREAGEAAWLERQHRDWCLTLAEQRPPEMLDPDHISSLTRELDNVRTALRSAIELGDAQVGLRLGVALWPLWYVRGLYAEGRAWLTELLALPGATTATGGRARALAWAGHLAFCEGDYVAAEALLYQALDTARTLQDEQATAVALQLLGTPARGRGDLVQAEALYQQARSINSRLASRVWEAMCLGNLAMAAADRGDHVSAEAVAAEALSLYADQGHPWGTARMREVLARVAMSRGDYRTARAELEEAVAFQRELGDRQGLVLSLPTLAQIAMGEQDAVRAGSLLAEGLALAHEAGDKLSVARGLEAVAILLAGVRPERAARLVGAAEALRDGMGAQLMPAELDRLGKGQAAVLRLLGQAAYAAARAEGRRLALANAVADAVRDAEAVAASDRRGAVEADPLTPRERQVAVLLARGLSNRQIAMALVISEGTARIHAEHVLGKLGLRSRVQMAAWARTHGLVSETDDEDMPAAYASGR